MRRLIALTIGILGLVLQAGDSAASAFRVTPIQVQLSGKGTTLLTLTNESDEQLRFQISVFVWNQGPAGEIELQPTTDVSFFPSLIALSAGQERKVRVASNVAAGDVEKTYRIFFEELPAAEKPVPEKEAKVRILTKMGIPIFIQPSKATAEAKVGELKMNDGKLSFRVSNSGNTHYSIRTIHVTATGVGNETVFTRDLDGWYVLAGGIRDYSVELPWDACSKVRGVKVEAVTDIATSPQAGTVSVDQNFPDGAACGKRP